MLACVVCIAAFLIVLVASPRFELRQVLTLQLLLPALLMLL